MHLSLDENDVTSTDPRRLQMVRAAAYFLLHAIGDLQDLELPTAPPVAPAAALTTVNTFPNSTAPIFPTGLSGMGAPTSTNVPPPPPPPPPTQNHYPNESGDAGDYEDETGDSNVVNFPTAGTVPPPPSSSLNAATVAAPPLSSVTVAGAASTAASAEYDNAGMPWDARIHQKAKGKKKDNTWKLIKGIDTAIVQAVTAELAARKGASAPVSLPVPPNFAPGTQTPGPILGTNSVPVPPVSNVPAPPGMPAPPASAPVSVPPPPAVGAVSSSPYRALIDKITEFTKAGKLAPAKVAEICQSHGAPSLMALNSMQTQMSARDPGLTVIQAVDKDVDAAALGLL